MVPIRIRKYFAYIAFKIVFQMLTRHPHCIILCFVSMDMLEQLRL
ncbi:Uncharacterised protein [Vibrio cholerae]|nr:Uncharacterised protein [Vibrio cholerae]CSI34673.1 Uncharacterised protein [Vibrio cholerae]